MKKLCILICLSLVLQMLGGCSRKEEDFQEPVNFYYCNNEVAYNSATGVIHPEIREGAGFYGSLTAFLQAYLLGPKNSDLYTLIPSDVYLVSCEISDNTATIVLSKSVEKLSGIDLVTACSALLLSVYEYAGITTISVSAKDGRLDDKDQFVLSMDDIVLIDASQ